MIPVWNKFRFKNRKKLRSRGEEVDKNATEGQVRKGLVKTVLETGYAVHEHPPVRTMQELLRELFKYSHEIGIFMILMKLDFTLSMKWQLCRKMKAFKAFFKRETCLWCIFLYIKHLLIFFNTLIFMLQNEYVIININLLPWYNIDTSQEVDSEQERIHMLEINSTKKLQMDCQAIEIYLIPATQCKYYKQVFYLFLKILKKQ